MRLSGLDYSSRIFLYAPIGLFLLIVFGVCVSWWLAADALSAHLKALNGREIAPGITLYYGTSRIAGFPFNLDTDMRDVTFTIATPHGPAQWHADRFAMHSLTYGPDETLFEAAGQQVVHWTRDDGKGRTLTFAVGSLRASATRSRGLLRRFDLDIVGFGSRLFTAQRLQFHLRRDASALDLFATVEDLRFAPGQAPDLGGQIPTARFSGQLAAAGALDGLLSGSERWTASVDQWRQKSGVLQLDEVMLEWSGLHLKGHGALKLDTGHRPQGGIAFHIEGLAALRGHAAKLARGPNNGLAAALLDRAGPATRLDTTLGFDNGLVTVGGEPADTVSKLY
ncbi:MAG: DUF2125 domain-containing protein [Alphaproteobacteria bacterium]|nr:DUF2125 domain-containing protein [Alphaproteobacteria bacterium]